MIAYRLDYESSSSEWSSVQGIATRHPDNFIQVLAGTSLMDQTATLLNAARHPFSMSKQ